MTTVALILCSILTVLLCVYYLSVLKFDYWKKKNVPHIKPVPMLGNYSEYISMKKYLGEVTQKLCQLFPNEPYFGTYYGTEPTLVLQDPEIIKLVFTKDFYYFNAREIAKYTPLELTTQGLFFTYGDTWKVVRQNLTPLFSSAKMRNMFYLVAKCRNPLDKMLDDERSMGADVVDIKALMIRYTMDCIGSCAFGIESKAMSEPNDNPFVLMGNVIFTTSRFNGYRMVFRAIWPKIFYGMGLKFFPSNIDIFFNNLLMGVFKQRDSKPTSRNDFVDLVLALKKNNYIAGDCLNPKAVGNKKIEMELTDELLVSQCVLFFGAGFETSASTLTWTLYELAKNQEAQRRAHEEIDEYLRRHNNKLTYECVGELPYIEACLNEAMRLYPVLAVITREVMDDYIFPSGLKVDKGVRIHLPVFHIHRDPKNFPDPETFRPERFYQDAKNDVKPYTFFPFGEGPRQCIASNMSAVALILCFIIAILLSVYYLSVLKFDYWKKKKVPHLKPWPILGNYGEYITMKKYFGEVSQKLCQQFPNEPYFGAYFGTEPTLVLQDPEIIKLVFTKDFYYFNAREISKYISMEITTQNIFFDHGDSWKIVRQNLTPLFSSAKMKNMFYLVEKCGHVLDKMLNEERAMSEDVVDMKALMIRYTMDCIGSCAFGIETKTMLEPKDNPFVLMGNVIFTTSKFDGFKLVFRTIWPKIFYALGLKYFPVDIDSFFNNLLKGVFEQREHKPSSRNDFIDQMLALKQNKYIAGDSLNPKSVVNKKIEMEVTDNVLVSQCVAFFGAGFETSASTLTWTLYELAKNQEAQRRAHEEVDEYMQRHNNKLTYECVGALPYIEACLNEAMRLYPVLAVITREVMDDYIFPSGLKVDKGVRIHLPVFHIHRDPKNFPDPETYRPERFYQDAKNDVKPYTFFPFGEGPRQCIGLRFAKMQTTVALITVLKKYRVELAEGTPSKLEFYPSSFLTNVKNAINLKLTPREGWEQRVFAS